MKKNLVVLAVIAFAFCFNMDAQESIKTFTGKWAYSCNDAPYEYQTGTIIIEHKENKSSARVVYNDGSKVEAHSLKAKEGILSFSVVVENESINIQLKKEGDKLKGKAINYYGEELMLTAVKK
ncbi:hypothetical protein [Aestuariivivens insulae]|uniref:hypothetical protein n=1 Tax=Aestuariivivens insulae TaxID=1621988 RepID=UPI001F563537|nr:hypothetical protein [Aestuariivivens insulae]